MKIKQPAFPTWINDNAMTPGMTLEDFFAAAALQGMYANPEHRYNSHFNDALEAYKMAEAMMQVRNR